MPAQLSRAMRSELEGVAVPASSGAEHFVQFYEDDAFLVDSMARYVGDGLEQDQTAIVIATGAHRAELASRLSARGVDSAGARAQGRYIALDAAETLSRFMVDDWPHPQRFVDTVGSVMASAAARPRPVRAFGEMVGLLCAHGKPQAAVRLEQLWNELAARHSFSLFCAYPISVFGTADDAQSLHAVCCAHSHVVPTERYVGLRRPADRFRAVARLQQKAAALDYEVARRIEAERRLSEVEHRLRQLEQRQGTLLEAAHPAVPPANEA